MRLHSDLFCFRSRSWPSVLLSGTFVMNDSLEEPGGLFDMYKSTFQLDLLIPSGLHFSLIRVSCVDRLRPLFSPLGCTLSCSPN